MSGIFGLFHLNGAPANAGDLADMQSLLARRGPDGAAIWHDGPVGLGHTLLATTPEAMTERLPLVHAASGCVITADVRLDNRPELLRALDLDPRSDMAGDGGIVLAAYLAWGEACVERLLGDFAFVIRDPRRNSVFCARDPLGVRPFYYHEAPGRLFAFASEPRAILVLPAVPYRINEARIADFLVMELEGIDKTGTFFEDVHRLPPAHTLTVTPDGVRRRCYWTLDVERELRLPSDEDYAKAFLEVFTEAVRCRLRGAPKVGSMLSGGMDSGAIVAVAREILQGTGGGPLPIFSVVAADEENCIESRTIRAALTMDGLDPHVVSLADMGDLLPELETLVWSVEEPFDYAMTMVFAVYLAAQRSGIKAVLDGIDADNLLSEGSYLARLLRKGRFVMAYREAKGLERFWGPALPARRELWQSARAAFVPQWLRRLRHSLRMRNAGKHVENRLRTTLMAPAFAQRIDLASRLETLAAHRHAGLLPDFCSERARDVLHPYLTVGVERYGRVASALGVEPRHPFLDRRVVAFCVALPGEQRLAGGWPKAILRRAMAGRLPDAVRWRRGKEHLGWACTTQLMGLAKQRLQLAIDENLDIISPFVDVDSLRRVDSANRESCDAARVQNVHDVACLGVWLRHHVARPRVDGAR